MRKKLLFISLIHRVGWVQTLGRNVTKFNVTNCGCRVGWDPISDNDTLFTLFYFEVFPKMKNLKVKSKLQRSGVLHDTVFCLVYCTAHKLVWFFRPKSGLQSLKKVFLFWQCPKKSELVRKTGLKKVWFLTIMVWKL